MPINVLLKCHDQETTRLFYRDILDFDVCDWEDGTTTARKGDCTLVFTSEDRWSGHPKMTGDIYLLIDDVDAYYESIKDKAIVLWPPQDMPNGLRAFGIKDYDEYRIAFAQKT